MKPSRRAKCAPRSATQASVLKSKRVVIAGGGLAGLTCAKYLLEAGAEVTLVEGLPFLGGRASTFRDADGEWIEQGLHLFLGVYSEFKKLLNDIGQSPNDVLCWTTKVHLQDPEGPSASYGADPLGAPLQTLLSVMGQNDYLDLLDKLSFIPLAAPAITSLETIRQKYDGLTVTEWWRQSNGREQVLERALRPLCRALQFTDPDEFSAYDFLGWIHHSICHLPSLRLAGYRGARDETIFAPLGKYLTDRGVTIKTNTRLQMIDYRSNDRSVAGFTFDDGRRVEADAYVVAIPAWAFIPLIPAALRDDPFFIPITKLPIAPAISVQLWFDREVTGTSEFFLVAHSLAPVYQEQSEFTYPVRDGSRVSVIVSPADQLLEVTDQEIIDTVLRSLQTANPSIASAYVTKSVVLKHRQHLIRPLPGAMSARPLQRTTVCNLFLAGDWTQQEFFGSQEGAVRGGKYCAREILSTLHL